MPNYLQDGAQFTVYTFESKEFQQSEEEVSIDYDLTKKRDRKHLWQPLIQHTASQWRPGLVGGRRPLLSLSCGSQSLQLSWYLLPSAHQGELTAG
jgi:hypothetical protein